MKRLVLVIMMMVLLICFVHSNSYAAATLEPIDNEYPSGTDDENKVFVLNSVDGIVAGAADEVFKFRSYSESGKIKRVIFLSQSIDCDVWLSLTDGQTITSAETIYSYENCNLGFMSTDLDVDYYNPSGETGAFLYFTISNTTTSITSWTLIIIYEVG